MSNFEDACAENNIPLFALPPKRPQYNGGIERTNRIMRGSSTYRGATKI